MFGFRGTLGSELRPVLPWDQVGEMKYVICQLLTNRHTAPLSWETSNAVGVTQNILAAFQSARELRFPSMSRVSFHLHETVCLPISPEDQAGRA